MEMGIGILSMSAVYAIKRCTDTTTSVHRHHCTIPIVHPLANTGSKSIKVQVVVAMIQGVTLDASQEW